MKRYSSDGLYSLLFHAGYLTLTEPLSTLKNNVFVKFPNDEVRSEFKRLLQKHLWENKISEPDYVNKTGAVPGVLKFYKINLVRSLLCLY